MKKPIKRILKWIGGILLIPVFYILISLVLSLITLERKEKDPISNKSIYLNTNGVHLEVAIMKEDLDSLLLSGIKHQPHENFLSFGWGDESFYLNTPTWGDLTFNTAFKAAFLKSSSLIHVTRYPQKQSDWVEVLVSENELKKLNNYLINSFEADNWGFKILLENRGYSANDDFYRSKGSYSCFKTCNTWINSGFKESGLKSCFWTPFDFGLIWKYE